MSSDYKRQKQTMFEVQMWIIKRMMMDHSVLMLIFISAFLNNTTAQISAYPFWNFTYNTVTTATITTSPNNSSTTTPITNNTLSTTTLTTTLSSTSTTINALSTTTPTTTSALSTTTPTTTSALSTTTPTTISALSTTTPNTTSALSTTTPSTTSTLFTTPLTTSSTLTTTTSTSSATPITTILTPSSTQTTISTTLSTSTVNPSQHSTSTQPTGNKCPEQTLDNLTFPDTAVGQISYSTQECPPGTVNAGIPMASAQCLNYTQFYAFGGLKRLDCDSNLAALESKVNRTLEENMSVASSVEILTSKPGELTSENITSAAHIVHDLLSSRMFNESVGVSAVATISQLMKADQQQYSGNTYDALQSVTKTLENFVLTMTSKTPLVQPNIALHNIKLSSWTPQVKFYSQGGLSDRAPERIGLGGDAASMTSSLGHPVDLLLTVKLQNDSQNDCDSRNLSIGVVVYENDNFFNSKQFASKLNTTTRVVSASLTDKHMLENVEFALRPQNISGLTLFDFACVFWDYDQRDWRTEGCVKVLDLSGVNCKCNHTTNFAVLVSFRADYKYSEALNWISIVGCSLSIVGLVLTTMYQIKTRKRRGANSTMLLVNICVCMTSYYLLFIFGINNPEPNSKVSASQQNFIPSTDLQVMVDQGPCTAITALLQYFLLATFVWNILYAAHVFFLIRNALNGPPRAFHTIAMIAGWGLPAVIVGLSLATTYRFKDPSGYRQEEFCWLASLDKTGKFDPKRPMLWGFLLPLAVMLSFNTSVLVYFSQTICCANPNLKSSRRTPLKKKILSSFSLAVVLGLSWVIGYLVLITQDKTLYIILSVIFCLCNTTQGVQIFILFTLKSYLKTRTQNKLDSKTESRGEP